MQFNYFETIENVVKTEAPKCEKNWKQIHVPVILMFEFPQGVILDRITSNSCHYYYQTIVLLFKGFPRGC